MRVSKDIIDDDGYVKSGFDYNLQVWVWNYKIATSPATIRQGIAGEDIRRIAGAECREMFASNGCIVDTWFSVA